MKKQKERLDKNYNIIPSKEEIYSDEMGEMVSEIVGLRDIGKLSFELANLLIKFVIIKEVRKETKDLTEMIVKKSTPEISTFYLNLNTKKYA